MLILPPNDIFDSSAFETVSIVSDTQQASSSELPEVDTSPGKGIHENLKKTMNNSVIDTITLDFQPLPIIEDKGFIGRISPGNDMKFGFNLAVAGTAWKEDPPTPQDLSNLAIIILRYINYGGEPPH
ncbi:hypothetical protein Trydic_g9052 [Trypoxylus dichotomus]